MTYRLTNVKDRDECNNRQGTVYSTRSNALIARLPTLMRLAESLTQDWLNKNESREMVMLTITLLYIINWLTTTLTGTLPNSQPTVQTFFNNWLWKAGTLTLDKRLLTNVNHYRRFTNDLSTMWTTSKNRLLTPQLNLTNNTRASNQLQSMDRNWPMIDDKLNTSPSPISSG